MTISSTTRIVGPFIGNGTVSAFPFTFKVFAASDLKVVRLNTTTMIETVLVLNSDYTVVLSSDQDTSPGGTVTLSGGSLATGQNLIITTAVSNTQPMDLTNQGGFYPEVINDALDRATMQIQQLQEGLDRSVKVPVTQPVSMDQLLADIVTVANDITNVDIVAADIANVNAVGTSIADVNTVAADLNEPVSEIETVAASIVNVDIVGTNIANVNAVGPSIANVNTVAAGISDVATVAADLNEPVSEIETVAASITNVDAVGTSISNVNTTATNIASVNTTATNIASVNTTATNIASVNSAATNMAAIIAAPTQAANAAASATAALNAKTAAETARDAAQLSAGVYATTAAGLAATSNGDYFSVVSGSTNEYLNLYLNDSGTAVLEKTYPSAASVDNWFRETLGAFFYQPYYEFSGSDLYFKPTGYPINGDSFFVRGGYLPNKDISYIALKNSVLAQSPALDPDYGVLGATSPSGVTDCILLKARGTLWYNPATDAFHIDTRENKRQNEIPMIHNNIGEVGDCQERAVMLDVLNRRYTLGLSEDPQKLIAGLFFVDPHYERDGNFLYVKPGLSGLNSIFIRGSYLPNAQWTYTKLKDDLALSIPSGCAIGVTSPSGVTDCLSFNVTAASATLWYDIATDTFGWGARISNRSGKIKLLEVNGTQISDCAERPEAYRKLVLQSISQTQSQHLCAIFTSRQVAAPGFPDINTATDTLTMPQDIVLYDRGVSYIIPTTTTVNLAVTPSSAKVVYFDTQLLTFVVRAFNSTITTLEQRKFLLVALIRYLKPDYVYASMTCHYTVNGKLLGHPRVPNPPDALVLGIHHRGYSGIAPENTLPAYVASANVNNSWVEGDIMFTSDNVPVLLHDTTIDRTSNGTGAIAGMTLATAKTYDFGSWKGSQFTGTTIPTWEEVLLLMKKLSLRGFFELKTSPTAPQLQSILSAITNTGMKGSIELDCFNYAVMQAIVAADPTQEIGFLSFTFSSAMIANCVALKTGQNKVSAVVNSGAVTKLLVEEAHQNGIKVVCWTVNNAASVPALAAAGVDGIMTDTLNIAEILRGTEGL
jgi:glycerophosphoryl diester phosphodiesterase